MACKFFLFSIIVQRRGLRKALRHMIELFELPCPFSSGRVTTSGSNLSPVGQRARWLPLGLQEGDDPCLVCTPASVIWERHVYAQTASGHEVVNSGCLSLAEECQ